jgi:malate synthase
MEDAATAEISRTQIWQWVHYGATLDDGRKITPDLIRDTIKSQLQHIRGILGPKRYDSGKFDLASELFEKMLLCEKLPEFLTLEAYSYVN